MIHKWLRPFCTKVRGTDGILDEIDNEFYIRFDCAIDTDMPEISATTCDIHIVPLAADDWKAASIRVVANASAYDVARFLIALRLDRLPASIRKKAFDEVGD